MVVIATARIDEIIDRLNEIEGFAGGDCLENSGEIWAYVAGLAEFDPTRIDLADPSGTNGRIPLTDGSMIHWSEHHRLWGRSVPV